MADKNDKPESAEKTVTIVFLENATYGSIPPEHFRKGDVRSMREDLAMRWVRRGVATADSAVVTAAKAGRTVEPPKRIEKLPDGVQANWRTLSAADAIALATGPLKADPEKVSTRVAAMSVIEAAVAEANK